METQQAETSNASHRPGVLESFRNSIQGVDSARQMAWGVTLGMMIGIVPKESAWCVLVGVVLILFHANLITGLVSAVAFSWIGPLVEPWTHQLGDAILSQAMVQSWLSTIFTLPVVPWLRLENTVVTGSIVVALAAALPLYRISYLLLARYRRTLIATIRRSFLSRWLLGEQSDNSQTQVMIDG